MAQAVIPPFFRWGSDEADLSAVEDASRAATWISGTQPHAGWPRGAAGASRAGTQASRRLSPARACRTPLRGVPGRSTGHAVSRDAQILSACCGTASDTTLAVTFSMLRVATAARHASESSSRAAMPGLRPRAMPSSDTSGKPSGCSSPRSDPSICSFDRRWVSNRRSK